jgi:hypothetical protein
MTMKKYALLALALLLAASHSEAATITPATPTAQDVITATILVADTATYGPRSTSITGNIVRSYFPLITIIGGPIPGFDPLSVSFGPLPPGTYIYEVYEVDRGTPFLISQQTIVVAPAIPVMNHLSMFILALFLAAIASFARQSLR